jgi:hypothetical protein
MVNGRSVWRYIIANRLLMSEWQSNHIGVRDVRAAGYGCDLENHRALIAGWRGRAGRCDSPGFTAQQEAYSNTLAQTRRILDRIRNGLVKSR